MAVWLRKAYMVKSMDSSRAFVSAALERSSVRMQTLLQLRWIALFGQVATVVVVGLYLRYPLPWLPLIITIGAGAVINIGLLSLYPRNSRFEGRAAFFHLSFDILQAGVLLFLTGGLANPFVVLLVVPVTIASTLLSRRGLAALLAMAVSILVILWFWALPLPWPGAAIALPPVYLLAVFIAVAIASAFMAAYVGLVSAESLRRAQALIATQSALEREAKMSALGSLAAAAAHELGGPLGTITLIARELVDQLGDDPDFGEDVRLLDREALRSRNILVGIAKRAEAEEPFPVLALDVLLHEVVEGVLPARVMVDIVATTADSVHLRRTPELLHGLANLLSNAVRHAGSLVTVRATVGNAHVQISIVDDGRGFDPDLLPHLGEPFLGPSISGSGGTGLGIFIATTLLERTGAKLGFRNLQSGGAEVDIRWQRSHIETDLVV